MEFLKDKNRIILSVISVLGAITMGYLLHLHYSIGGSSFCDISEGFSCDIVNKSPYAKVAGIPLSLMGLIYFIGVLFIGIFESSRKIFKYLSLVSIALLGPSLYLTGVEYLVLKSFCVLCEFSKLLMVIVAVCTGKIAGGDAFSKIKVEEVVFAVILGAGLGAATYFVQNLL